MGTRKMQGCFLVLAYLILFCLSATGQASKDPFPAIAWIKGPYKAEIAGVATINVPKGYAFTGAPGTRSFLEQNRNPSSESDVGLIVPIGNSAAQADWFMLFDFHPVGLISDKDQASLDSASLLSEIQRSTDADNQIRKQKGWPAFRVTGWERKPFYDSVSHNLTWGMLGQGDGDKTETVNYSSRILGRRGEMSVDLVLDPRDLPAVLPSFNGLLTGFQYTQGNRYGDYVSGDKLAGYGLTALIAGGAGAIAAKTGILAGLWKFGLAIAAILWKFILLIIAAAAAMFRKTIAHIRSLFSSRPHTEPDDVMKQYNAQHDKR